MDGNGWKWINRGLQGPAHPHAVLVPLLPAGRLPFTGRLLDSHQAPGGLHAALRRPGR